MNNSRFNGQTSFLWLAGCVVLGAVGFLLAVPPLSLDGFRDEVLPDAPAEPKEHLRANQACYVCHENLKEDKLVLDHTKDRIGCMRCHGESVNHRNDEDNITPPDKMFPLGTIDAMCLECHPKHNAPARKVIERLRERQLTATSLDELVCSSCHYDHRLSHRTVRWDKTTGELLMRKPKKDSAKASAPATGAASP